MGKDIDITAADGHRLSAYLAEPAGEPRAGLVIAQEMYGVNGYIREVCDFYAGHGFLAIAPNLYDRLEPGLVFEYTDADNARAKALYRNYDWDKAVTDLEAARDAVAPVGKAGKVAILGYCFGGSLAWLAACRSEFAAAVSYYGGEINRYLDEDARCPLIIHVGELDTALSPEKRAAFRARHPGIPVYEYAGAVHGFDNARRGARHHAEATGEARERSLAFLATILGLESA